MSIRRAFLATASLLAACSWGPRLEDAPFATSANGAIATIAMQPGPRVRGELLAFQPDGVLILREDARRIALARYSAIGWLKIPTARRANVTSAQSVPSSVRLASRYPQGISPAVLAELLAVQQQAAVDTLP